MRLSQENEDCQRASNHQSPTPDRPQATLRLTFPKSARLKTRQEFKRVQRGGRKVTGGHLVFQIASEDFTCQKLGITVTKQFGSSVTRNLFKRRVREAFRMERSRLPTGMQVHVSPRGKGTVPTLAQVKEDFNLIYAK